MTFLFSHNEMLVKDYGKQGTEIIFTKGKPTTAVITLLSFFSFAMWNCIHYHQYTLLQNCVLLAVILTTLYAIIYCLRIVHKESLLIISSIGITSTRCCLLGVSHKYFDVHHVEDIVIVEAVSMHQVIFELVVIQKTNTSDVTSPKIYPLFLDFQPKLADLLTIYRQAQEKLRTMEER
ncbi:phosphatidylinositol N-acetylglucosaminyltransferase subunit H-like [Dreissena polymorpha]|uniref:phosphatidylinositol N-acetylglucosaminyltransferase subunit H-like n=1 Tax=Dreissena polymorpha TaxID=45954 RepID=UPI00226508DE|nr:phosphatidylinositol N-acetylglucosaminyltransferase subunit H-like [Dreissena polymorpha]